MPQKMESTCPNCTHQKLELYQDFKDLRVKYFKYTKASMWRRVSVERMGRVKYTLSCTKCSYTKELTEDEVRDDILWEHQRNYQ